jgi:hypothetical protein
VTSLLDLAAKVEALTGPCRETNTEIALAIGWKRYAGDNWIGPRAEICVPDYTASLDAAMTLVPTQMEWEAGTAKLMDICWARVIAIHDSWKGKAATPAIALTAASLKARAAISGASS